MSTQASGLEPQGAPEGTRILVVGVDGSESNKAAVEWACAEARSAHGKILLVSACPLFTAPMPEAMGDYAVQYQYEEDVRKSLGELSDHFRGEVDDFSIQVTSGSPVHVLLGAADKGAELLVMGQRGMGAVKRMLVGSTSIAVAGRSAIPVIVVPDGWVRKAPSTAPIVVGVEPLDGLPEGTAKTGSDALEFAFSRAARLDVPLVIVSASEPPALYAWSPADLEGRADECEALLQETVQPWRERFPEVEVVTRSVATKPVNAILDAADGAQMVVLGRHTGPHHLGGFSLGSTARGVLHYAECPVAVVPSHSDGEDDSERVRAGGSEVFAPTF